MNTQNPTEPAQDDAKSPNYGDFGQPTALASDAANAPEGRSGSNDNPDEFSEIRNKGKAEAHPDDLADQPGHVDQNQNPQAVRDAQHADTDEQRAAWSKDDPRYAGGGSHNAPTGATPETTVHNAAAADKSAGDRA